MKEELKIRLRKEMSKFYAINCSCSTCAKIREIREIINKKEVNKANGKTKHNHTRL